MKGKLNMARVIKYNDAKKHQIEKVFVKMRKMPEHRNVSNHKICAAVAVTCDVNDYRQVAHFVSDLPVYIAYKQTSGRTRKTA